MTPGNLGPYEIKEPLGNGGMGEVYRAHDPSLKRDVAIKVLPAELASDPERLARLEREAHLLAALNHPNVATIHGLEEAQADDGTSSRFLVLELVEGETLEERLRSGPLEVEEALELAVQIARGLEAAHAQGIVHRDLKPGNVKITPDGLVKVLDFGLAKPSDAVEADAADEEGLTRSPTVTVAGTEAGVILGTAAYMSPEQARGKPVDERTDVWSFGCVLYEMLTGRRPFQGEDVSETLASILKEAPDWEGLPAGTAPLLRGVLRRCLRKDPDRRMHHIADARLEIEEALAEPAVVAPAAAPGRRSVLPWAVATLVTAALAAGLTWQLTPHEPEATVERWSVLLPDGHRVARMVSRPGAIAISPDGRLIVYRGTDGTTPMLYRRTIDEREAMPIAGTEEAWGPFFSPDSQWLGFIIGGSIFKVSLRGGPAVPVFEGRIRIDAASWTPDDMILFSTNPAGAQAGVFRVAADGRGVPERVTVVDLQSGHRAHYNPQLLPDGRHVLFHVRERGSQNSIAVAPLDTGELEILLEGGSAARYLPTGHLLFASEGTATATLLARPFDLATLSLSGQPEPLVGEVLFDATKGQASYDVASNGALVFVGGGLVTGRNVLQWVDADGERTPVDRPLEAHEEPRVAPDGRRYAITLFEASQHDVWVYDIEGDGSLKLTVEGSNRSPVWGPRREWIYFTTDRQGGSYNLGRKPADGSGDVELLLPSEKPQTPGDVSRDASELIYAEQAPESGWDIWALPLDAEGDPREVVRTDDDELRPRLSPDGRWLAFEKLGESSIAQVFVQPFPGPGAKRQISFDGGVSPVWAKDGSALYFLQNGRIMVSQIETAPRFRSSRPEVVLEEPSLVDSVLSHAAIFEVMPDGRLLIISREIEGPDHLDVVVGFFEDVKNRFSGGR